MNYKNNILIIAVLLAVACNKKDQAYDASGTFESTEIIIPAEGTGIIRQFDVSEGQELKAGQYIGYIDTLQLSLKKEQLMAQIQTTLKQKPNIPKQLAALQVQLASAEREQRRVASLLKADAATQKQMDDANAQVDVIRKQIEAQASALGINTESISWQAHPLQVQVAQVEAQIADCRIVNNAAGTVIAKYAEANEMATPGKPLYKVADLDSMILRAYITGQQLASIRLGQHVKVLVDNGKGAYREYAGLVEWISDKAEFTPKTIQTKDERANLVYAIKIRVKNDGLIKIGMYADVKF